MTTAHRPRPSHTRQRTLGQPAEQSTTGSREHHRDPDPTPTQDQPVTT